MPGTNAVPGQLNISYFQFTTGVRMAKVCINCRCSIGLFSKQFKLPGTDVIFCGECSEKAETLFSQPKLKLPKKLSFLPQLIPQLKTL